MISFLNHGGDSRATTFSLTRLRAGLKPFKLHWFPTLGSTNSHAARMRREGRLLAPAVVLTGHQSAGRGRGANVWHAPAGVVTVTFVLSAHDTLPPQHVPLIAGLAVRDVAAEIAGADVGIKWPNDLWHDGLKLAGLLCERVDRVDLIGVGINANVKPRRLPRALATTATSLAVLAHMPIDQTDLVIALAQRLRAAFSDARTALAAVHDQLARHDVLHGLTVRVEDSGRSVQGICTGIDAQGRLVLRTAAGIERIVAGTVRVVR